MTHEHLDNQYLVQSQTKSMNPMLRNDYNIYLYKFQLHMPKYYRQLLYSLDKAIDTLPQTDFQNNLLSKYSQLTP